ncbi:MAG: hypothetical protein WA741_02470 [Candidatus Sulfotelmatobacter sp.]
MNEDEKSWDQKSANIEKTDLGALADDEIRTLRIEICRTITAISEAEMVQKITQQQGSRIGRVCAEALRTLRELEKAKPKVVRRRTVRWLRR